MATNVERGAALRAAREAKPWTQAQLAHAARVSTRTVIRAELGGDATAETILALCGALGIDSSALPKPADPNAVETTHDDSVLPEPSALPTAPIRSRLGAGPRRLLAGACLAGLCVTAWHVAWAGSLAVGLSDAQSHHPLYGKTMSLGQSLALAQDMMSAGKAVVGGDPGRAETWDGLFARRSLLTIDGCPRVGFIQLLTGSDGGGCSRQASPPQVLVNESGPGAVDVTVGPLRQPALTALSRMLPRDPRLTVTAAYSRTARADAWGSLRFEPAALSHDQVPLPGKGSAYLNVRIEPKGMGR